MSSSVQKWIYEQLASSNQIDDEQLWELFEKVVCNSNSWKKKVGK